LSSQTTQRDLQEYIAELLQAVDEGTLDRVRQRLSNLSPAEIAHIIESLPPRARQVLWQLTDLEDEGEILQELGEEVQGEILGRMDADEVVAITEDLELDDVADILQQLPGQMLQEVLASMDAQDRHRVEQVLHYDEETAGGLMNTDTITVLPRHSLDVVLRYLRRHSELPPATDSIFVVNTDDYLVGVLPLGRLLVSDPSTRVRDIMQTDLEAIPATMPDDEVARLFERNDWISAPVVDEAGKLIGRITIDDVVDVIREDLDHSLMGNVGLSEEEDTFAPLWKAARRRAIWLGANLATAFIASGVINMFQGTIDKVVALAVLMPIVASMGGVAGSQTLTVVVRGMALGQIGRANAGWLINREVAVAAANGMLWALVAAAAATLWFNDMTIGAIIAAAMVINLIAAALAGVLLPLAMRSLNIDPALAGSVVLTTITDAVGFMTFLGLATLFYA
jgi:magnesium transporter